MDFAYIQNKRVAVPVILFVSVLIYTFAASVFIREILLPEYLPHLHAGEGFFIGGDSIGYQAKAIEFAEKIRENGWAEWTLYPTESNRDPPAAIAAAIYVLFGSSLTWLMVFNALIHALAALTLFLLMRVLFRCNWSALAATLPFIFMPTAASWYSQLHKDGVFILGVYIFLSGWVLLVAERQLSLARWIFVALLFALGIFTMWVEREYAISVMQGSSFLLGVVLILRFILPPDSSKSNLPDAFSRVLAVLLLIGSLSGLAEIGGSGKIFKPQQTGLLTPSKAGEFAPSQAGEFAPSQAAKKYKCIRGWDNKANASSFIDRKVSGLIAARDGLYAFPYGNTGSTIDHEYCIRNLESFIRFIPRAFQVGFLAPFPRHWTEEGVSGGTLRKVTGLEMIIIYIALASCAGAVWSMRKEPALWTIAVFAVPLVVLMGIIFPNMGALHRHRYGYLMLLVGIGAGWLVRQWLARRQAA